MINGNVNAQKFGHINTGNLLMQMPETKAADSLLKIYQDSLVAIGQVKGKAFQEEISAFAKEYQEGNLTPVVAQKKQTELQQKKDALEALQGEVIDLVGNKREALLAPILDKVQEAINSVGKEGNYTMIFDTSIFNTILFAQESDDLEGIVKKKLGI